MHDILYTTRYVLCTIYYIYTIYISIYVYIYILCTIVQGIYYGAFGLMSLQSYDDGALQHVRSHLGGPSERPAPSHVLRQVGTRQTPKDHIEYIVCLGSV